ncbi:MAG: cell division protein FtsA [Spirochaetaceae bacterium]|jgi:cell division protein FtsA|nr:cell division protein FtsA [Spirochaetaceae bacterium]
MAKNNIVVGLDIGTTTVRAIIAERDPLGNFSITGVGQSPSTGLRKGVVVNIEATLRSIAVAMEAAEDMSRQIARECWIGIGGNHVEGVISRGVVAVKGNNRDHSEISEDDLEHVRYIACSFKLPMDRTTIEVIPQTYIVDGQAGIRDPLHMIGMRLESEVLIITCSQTSEQNLVKCVNRAGFTVNGAILQTLAAGRAVLTEEEKEMGAALLDLGGGTSNILAYQQGAAFFTSSIPAGGNQVTNDISIVKNIAFDAAEKIKIEAGCCWEPFLEGIDDSIIVPGMGGRPPILIPRSQILQIVKPRMVEIFQLVKAKIEEVRPLRTLGGGIVLTGGGANLAGVAELAAEVFNKPVRIGNPLPAGGLVDEYRNPVYATAVGLVLEGNDREGGVDQSAGSGSFSSRTGGAEWNPLSVFGKIGGWIKREFF